MCSISNFFFSSNIGQASESNTDQRETERNRQTEREINSEMRVIIEKVENSEKEDIYTE